MPNFFYKLDEYEKVENGKTWLDAVNDVIVTFSTICEEKKDDENLKIIIFHLPDIVLQKKRMVASLVSSTQNIIPFEYYTNENISNNYIATIIDDDFNDDNLLEESFVKNMVDFFIHVNGAKVVGNLYIHITCKSNIVSITEHGLLSESNENVKITKIGDEQEDDDDEEEEEEEEEDSEEEDDGDEDEDGDLKIFSLTPPSSSKGGKKKNTKKKNTKKKNTKKKNTKKKL